MAPSSNPLRPIAAWHSRGRLPHWEAGETAQSITFRLADSLPRGVILNLLEGEEGETRRERFEALLDAGHGEGLLATPLAGQIVQDALLHFDGDRYRLHAWCVMPNHVHVLATLLSPWSLSAILHSWKSFTGKRINAEVGRRGPLWWEEYFDRAIRDDAHFETAKSYIKANPVKAGLCALPDEWPFSSARVAARSEAGETPALL
jgi:putative DNA methylase